MCKRNTLFSACCPSTISASMAFLWNAQTTSTVPSHKPLGGSRFRSSITGQLFYWLIHVLLMQLLIGNCTFTKKNAGRQKCILAIHSITIKSHAVILQFLSHQKSDLINPVSGQWDAILIRDMFWTHLHLHPRSIPHALVDFLGRCRFVQVFLLLFIVYILWCYHCMLPSTTFASHCSQTLENFLNVYGAELLQVLVWCMMINPTSAWTGQVDRNEIC